MAFKIFLIFVTVFAFVEFLEASPTRRQLITNTEATASDAPVTNDGAVWDDNDEFDLDGDGWYSQPVSPSAVPNKAADYSEYDDDYSRGNVMGEFGESDDEEEGDDHQEQEAEEDDESARDSEFLFQQPRDTRLMLEDDDDDQAGPIKVRHTGRSSYPRVSDGAENSIEASSEEDREDSEHPYEFAIDEDDKDEEDEDDEEPRKGEDSAETSQREDVHEDEDDEDEFVSEGDDDSDMFANPEEESAQVIYGDHVFLY